MGRMHPHYCQHDKMVDGGSFFELDEIEGCEICDNEADERDRKVREYDKLKAKDKEANKLRSEEITFHYRCGFADAFVVGLVFGAILFGFIAAKLF